MDSKRVINVPFAREQVSELKAGDYVYLTGTLYSARDAAHKRLFDSILQAEGDSIIDVEGRCDTENGTKLEGVAGLDGKALYDKGILPLDITGNIFYYLGPTPAKEGQVIGSAGPTTSSRMDKYTPLLLSKGLTGMIGKGKRSKEVIDAIVANKAVYFAAVGGAGALLSKCIKKSEVIAYDDLGTEAIRKMEVEDFPVIVVIDSQGNNLYETAVEEYNSSKAAR